MRHKSLTFVVALGLVAGLLATEAFLQARRINQPVLGWIGAVAVGAIAVVISVATV